ncbi:MAG: 5-(carboxyamino)imidazole ribonucleotide synthase [SAR202 cluster bacterium]|jgi:5-(carboxyamino)imidazole ribonucleotide synthase|nr:MAG: 5-(carboxyamino)imidazole ribonucleotide synthase [SAR202 cluster bacterium]MBF06117.1 5-(carboxyamino)imidazole ribonucleotide synthase [Chloroflexota bacterium]MCH2529638.1 5-(carboxyamino)imidazole ribonucleotide synthase [Dehalococcoidia bacterium]KAA1301116.1 MAG: 5-(carboxyamino)imidazole ribonucleotide synthase [SAR202 cluster bacterium]KAA1304968.1 MAG: 5-(carboxyamino)imidazole ribonucleotide synthase [SAR202 cluster bacterium]|tara:strand:- start:9 stop:1169 length:1161 start_codon:yes stop_codon:yes gene_type:complete
MELESPLNPGSTIGIIGGGQLGRMLAIAARQMDYKTVVLDPDSNCPAGQVADRVIRSDYSDLKASSELAALADVVTYEFENVDADSVSSAEKHKPVRPSSSVLRTTQNRLHEKKALLQAGIPVANFRKVDSLRDLEDAASVLGYPMVLKTATEGYDGKGQSIIDGERDLAISYDQLSARNVDLIVEQFVSFKAEVSTICARTIDGMTATFDPAENIHRNHILDTSIVPARIDESVTDKARIIATDIAEKLDVIGLIAVEMFVTQENDILVNELAPRPHNSGHYTMDGCDTSQFEQLVRILAGMPITLPKLHSPTVMVNLLGEIWEDTDGNPDWQRALELPGVSLHLYGKSAARVGRKMGHINVVAETVEEALYIAVEARERAWRRA